MRRWLTAWALSLALLLACGAAPAMAQPERADVQVASVQDGDTFSLRDGRRVRVAGIDTPEKHPLQYGAEESARRAGKLLAAAGGRVRLHVFSSDHYGRLVAEVFLPSGESFNEKMVREGMAVVYWHKELPEELGHRLLAAQKKALSRRAGNWKFVLENTSAKGPFVGNRNSFRFFPENCQELRRVSARNRVVFSSLEEAFEYGFYPARECGIWPLKETAKRWPSYR